MSDIQNASSINAPHGPIGRQDTYKIISGEALGVIEQYGWESYRQKLLQLDWYSFANTQIAEIKKLRKNSQIESYFTQEPDRSEVTKIILDYAEDIRVKYTQNSNHPFFALPKEYTIKKGNKLTIKGRYRPNYFEKQATRVYMAASIEKLAEAFELLREDLAAHHVLENINLVMNLEALDVSNLKIVDNNAIILYVPDSNPIVLTKICASIKRLKQAAPLPFQLSKEQEATVRAVSASEFMIPLDNTTWFIGQEKEKGNRSFHWHTVGDFVENIYMGKPKMVDGLPNIQQYMNAIEYFKSKGKDIVLSNIPIFSGRRKLTMPGLVVKS